MLVKMQYNEIQLRLLYASHCVNALNFAEILTVNYWEHISKVKKGSEMLGYTIRSDK